MFVEMLHVLTNLVRWIVCLLYKDNTHVYVSDTNNSIAAYPHTEQGPYGGTRGMKMQRVERVNKLTALKSFKMHKRREDGTKRGAGTLMETRGKLDKGGGWEREQRHQVHSESEVHNCISSRRNR